eukprot:GHVR01177587.1.p1 GENE.GHVR01177587.1~~GHVR01177587.1.p1  ORF type:complete len:190 (-),score=34.62 GHVR01177587.1:15-584(-)
MTGCKAADDTYTWGQCPDCQRNFHKENLEKHQAVCKKVFIEKRSPFDSQKRRVGHLEVDVNERTKAKSPPKQCHGDWTWRVESSLLRESVKLAKEKKTAQPELHPCPNCERKFVSPSLQKHAKVCERVFGNCKEDKKGLFCYYFYYFFILYVIIYICANVYIYMYMYIYVYIYMYIWINVCIIKTMCRE